MDGIFAVLGSIPLEAWLVAAGTTALVAGIGLFPYGRRAFHQWRLDRRLARDPMIARDELFDYHWLMCDELEPLDVPGLVRGSLAAGLATGAYVAVAAAGLEHWWDYGHWVILAGGALYATWRWHNDPPELREGESPYAVVTAFLEERDAVLGLGSAIVVVLLIMVAVFALF